MCGGLLIFIRWFFICLYWDIFMRWLVMVGSKIFNSEVAIINTPASFTYGHRHRHFKLAA